MPSTSARLPQAATFLSFVVGYFCAFILAERAYGTLAVPSPFWLPDSVLLTALLLTPRSQWWVFATVIWPIRLFWGAVPGTPMWFQFVTIANDMTKGLAAAYLLQRFIRTPIRLHTFHEFLIFLGIAGIAVPAVSALAAAPARYMLGDPVWRAMYQWFLGDLLAQVIVTPTILYWFTSRLIPQHRVRESIIVFGGLTVALLIGFLGDHRSPWLTVLYLPLPFLVWATVRLGPFGTSNALTLVAVASVISAANGSGVFADDSPSHAALSIQLFLLMLAVGLFSLAILVVERESLLSRDLRRGRELLDAQERERRRIARELHDDFGQRLAVLHIGIQQLRESADVSEHGRQRLTGIAQDAAQISRDINSLSHALHPFTIDILGIEDAIGELCQQFRNAHGLTIQLECRQVPRRLAPDVSLCVYRIAQEALRNVVKHSGAVTASVQLSVDKERLTLGVSDSGRGFNIADPAHGAGLGLVNMQERLRPLAGELTIQSMPGAGTQIRAVVPLRRNDDAEPAGEMERMRFDAARLE